MKLRTITISILIASLVLPAFAAKNPMKPGKWEVTVSAVMSGPEGSEEQAEEPTTKIECVTREEVEDLQFIRELIEDDEECELLEYKVRANTISWAMKCSDGLSSEGTMAFSGGGSSYKSESRVTTDEMVVRMKITGKYLGGCEEE